jgi:hypothetical protein
MECEGPSISHVCSISHSDFSTMWESLSDIAAASLGIKSGVHYVFILIVAFNATNFFFNFRIVEPMFEYII